MLCRRQQIANELQILSTNLTDLSWSTRSGEATEGDGVTASEGQGGRSNVLGFYNAFIDYSNGLVNLAVEYMDSGSLEDLVQSGGCSDETVLADIAQQTLRGLAFLHRNNTIHRDIKPANILCTLTTRATHQPSEEVEVPGYQTAGRQRSDTLESCRSVLSVSVKLADFGISKVVDANSPAHTFIGTICYMSPERITGSFNTD